MTDDEPIILADACKRYPRAKLTVYALRAEHARGRLDIFRLGRRQYTTPAAMREMVCKCQEDAKPWGPVAPVEDIGEGAAVLRKPRGAAL